MQSQFYVCVCRQIEKKTLKSIILHMLIDLNKSCLLNHLSSETSIGNRSVVIEIILVWRQFLFNG